MAQVKKVTPKQVLEIRKECRKIAKNHGYGTKVSVKMGKGSMKNFLMVQGPWDASTQFSFELCRFLLGYGLISPSYFGSIEEASASRYVSLALLVKQ